ncbi:MAG: hypothetical protein LBT93_01605 [Treponema sp.]|jgi:hypothetical protein|nr:hypothetical protein [Treponema sp.]
MYKKGFFAGIGLTGILFFTACAGEPQKTLAPITIPQPVEAVEVFQVQDHAAKAAGGEIPRWVSLYLYNNIGGIENLPEYQNAYVFIADNRGRNFNALRQWLEGFTIMRDFPRLVASRLQGHLTALSAGNPDESYGPFFEQVIKKSSDAFYYGATGGDKFWVLVQYFEKDGITLNREVYLCLILVSIDKALLEAQINEILSNIKTDTFTRDQLALINQLKENFYWGF